MVPVSKRLSDFLALVTGYFFHFCTTSTVEEKELCYPCRNHCIPSTLGKSSLRDASMTTSHSISFFPRPESLSPSLIILTFVTLAIAACPCITKSIPAAGAWRGEGKLWRCLPIFFSCCSSLAWMAKLPSQVVLSRGGYVFH